MFVANLLPSIVAFEPYYLLLLTCHPTDSPDAYEISPRRTLRLRIPPATALVLVLIKSVNQTSAVSSSA
ncbi:hypothetical protein RUM43_013765 [Polyplax serrata]|uniref:Uncharacterized protein n=1 Tax=Polyplax serrata TaxID=468196 RepID=A0AAN8P4F1_POLSC